MAANNKQHTDGWVSYARRVIVLHASGPSKADFEPD